MGAYMKRRDFHRLLIYGTATTPFCGRMVLGASASTIEVIPLQEEHVQDAAVLLTNHYLAIRQQQPALPSIDEAAMRMAEVRAERGLPAYDENAGLLTLLTTRPFSPRPRRPAVAAFKDGQLVGYLRTSDLDTNSAYTGMQNLAVNQVYGDQIYREMYASVSQQWRAEGGTLHFVKVFANDKQANETWFSLGFGQVTIQGIRDTNYSHERATGIEVVPAQAEHIDILVQIQLEHRRSRSEAPMFIRYESPTSDSIEVLREVMEALLHATDNHCWVAFQNGNPAGMMNLRPPAGSGLSPLLQMTRTVVVREWLTGEAARDPNVRGVLLDTALNWARGQGYEHCYIRFSAADNLAHNFWYSVGFQPIAYWLMRNTAL